MPYIYLLKKELIIFFSTLTILIVVLVLSFIYMDEKKYEKKQSLEILLQTKNKYRLAKKQQKILQDTRKEYQEIVKQGLLLKENRLNWIKAIDTIADKYQVPVIKYNIAKQALISDAGMKLDYPGINIYQSKMVIDMRLLHVDDFIVFSDKLEQYANGVFDIDGCELKRLYIDFNDIVKHKKNENISVKCSLLWLSVQPKVM